MLRVAIIAASMFLSACNSGVMPVANTEENDQVSAELSNKESPLKKLFVGKIKPTARIVLDEFKWRRMYSSKDFPLSINEHEKFRSYLRSFFWKNINSPAWDWSDTLKVQRNYLVENLGDFTINQVKIQGFKILNLHTKDELPILVCYPPSFSQDSPKGYPAVIVFSGHTSSSGLDDLMVDDNSYQKALSRRLCENGFVSIAVEKLDSGYTSIRMSQGLKNEVEREPGGGADDELEVSTALVNIGSAPIFARQTMANLAAFDYLKTIKGVDVKRIGAAGVSFGGWQALHLSLLRPDEISAISNYGGMWSYLEIHEDSRDLLEFEGVNDFSQSFPGIFMLGDQNRFLLAVAGVKMQIGYGKNDLPYLPHARYYYPLIMNQYDVLGARDLLQIDLHEGGHEFPVEKVLTYFRRVL